MLSRLWPRPGHTDQRVLRVAPSGPTVALLRLAQRRVLAHPRRRQYVEPGLASLVEDSRVVVDQHHDRPLLRQPAQRLDLEDAGRPEVVVGAQHQWSRRQAVPAEPPLGDAAQPFGAAGEVHDVVDLGEPAHRLRALVEQWVLRGTVEERAPVLRALADMTQPVPHVGEHAVDVDHRHHGEVGGAHAGILPCRTAPTRWTRTGLDVTVGSVTRPAWPPTRSTRPGPWRPAPASGCGCAAR